MPPVTSCPDVHAYQRFLLGQLSTEEGEMLALHLEEKGYDWIREKHEEATHG